MFRGFYVLARLPFAESTRPICRIEQRDHADAIEFALSAESSGQFTVEPAGLLSESSVKMRDMIVSNALAGRYGEKLAALAKYAHSLLDTIEPPEGKPQRQSESTATATKEPHVSANARMIDTLHKKPESKDWSKRQWADHLHCSPSAVQKAPAWKAIMKGREENKRRQKDRARSPFDD